MVVIFRESKGARLELIGSAGRGGNDNLLRECWDLLLNRYRGTNIVHANKLLGRLKNYLLRR